VEKEVGQAYTNALDYQVFLECMLQLTIQCASHGYRQDNEQVLVKRLMHFMNGFLEFEMMILV